MNTFIKRSMQLGLTALFIGTAVVPACAQRNKWLENLSKVFGKKPTLTETTGTVAPHTPVIDPILTRNAVTQATHAVSAQPAVPNFTPAINAALNTNVERLLIQGATHNNGLNMRQSTQMPKTATTKKVTQAARRKMIEKETKQELEKINEGFDRYSLPEEWTSKVDFRGLITPNTPDYIPVFGFGVSQYGDYIEDHTPFFRLRRNSWYKTKAFHEVRDYCDDLDRMFFIISNGQVVIDVAAVKNFKNYGDALEEMIRQRHPIPRIKEAASTEAIQYLTATRNAQIATALKVYARTQQVPSTDIVPNFTKVNTDPTTQRTAQEIQFLLENLPEDNPLRQDIEKTLEQNGYRPPALTPVSVPSAHTSAE